MHENDNVLVMNAGSKLTTTPVSSDDSGIGESLAFEML